MTQDSFSSQLLAHTSDETIFVSAHLELWNSVRPILLRSSLLYPVIIAISLIPASLNAESCLSSSDTPPIFNRHFGFSLVRAFIRLPRPAARIIALMKTIP